MACCPDYERLSGRLEKGFSMFRLVNEPPRPAQVTNAILYRSANADQGGILPINYCPWCGTWLNSNPRATTAE